MTMHWQDFSEAAERLEGKHWRTRIARRLGRSPSTIWRWEKKGFIPKAAEGAVKSMLDIRPPKSQSDLIAEALIKALDIKMIGERT
jgi:transposase-like protein